LQSLQDVTPFCPFDMRLIPVYHIKSHDSMTQTLLSKNINIFAEFWQCWFVCCSSGSCDIVSMETGSKGRHWGSLSWRSRWLAV